MNWVFAKKNSEPGTDTVRLTICDDRLSQVSKVLKRCLPGVEYQRCWSKWRPVLQRHQLFSGTPFKNIVKFVKTVAREHGLDHSQEKKLRSELFALSFNTGEEQTSRPRKTFQVRPDQINQIRFIAPGLDKFENATMVVTSPKSVVLMTKRGLLLGAQVKILLQNESGDFNSHSALLFHGSVRKISSLKLGSRYKYLVKVKNTELKMTPR